MKNLIFLFVLMTFVWNFSYSQELPKEYEDKLPQPGKYQKNPNLNKFRGTWQWTSKDTVLTIVIEKYKYKSKRKSGNLKDYSEDKIIGWHEFRVGNEVIESSMSFIGSEYEDRKHTISGGNVFDPDNLVRVSFKDISKDKKGKVNLEIRYEDENKLYWDLYNTPGVIVVDMNENIDHSFTLPKEIVLTRIKK